MNSQEIWNNIASMTTNKAIHKFAEILQDEDNKETLLVGIEIIANRIDIILGVNNSEDLRSNVLVVASSSPNKTFAGFVYNPEEHLPVDDENFDSADEGLSWVAWADLWDALEKVAQYNLTKD